MAAARRLQDLSGATLRVAGGGHEVANALASFVAKNCDTPASFNTWELGVNDEAVASATATLLLPSFSCSTLEQGLALVALVDDVTMTSGERPLLFASTLDVLGQREGIALERSVLAGPLFPFATSINESRWDVETEVTWIRETMVDIAARADHAVVRSQHLDQTKRALSDDHEPTSGRALKRALAQRRADWCRAESENLAAKRARDWGFAQTRGWFFALAEQRLASHDPKAAIVRLGELTIGTGGEPAPADLANFVAAVARGEVPAFKESVQIDFLPIDYAARALAVALQALLSDGGAPLMHASLASNNQPLSGERFLDLCHLHLRGEATSEREVSVLESSVPDAMQRGSTNSQRAQSRRQRLGRDLKALFALSRPMLKGALQEARTPLRQGLRGHADPLQLALKLGLPVRPKSQRVRAQKLRLLARRCAGKSDDLYRPDQIDWRRYLLDRLLPQATLGNDGDVDADEKPQRRQAYDSLVHLLEEMAQRHGAKAALTLFAPDADGDGNDERGLDPAVTVSYRELLDRAKATACRLRAHGVLPGDRVLLSGLNHPDWAIVAFATFGLSARLVPVDPGLSPVQFRHIVDKSRPAAIVLDKASREQFGPVLTAPPLDLHLSAQSGPTTDAPWGAPDPETPASVLFTSGTTGDPKGVVLSHQNFTALIASLGEVFKTSGDDRALSVLPLHHTLEFACGLLLPLSAGAQVFYPGELSGPRVLRVLREARITGMVGVPAVWQLLDRRIRSQVAERGPRAQSLFEAATRFNLKLGSVLGADVGKVLFKSVHDELGGHLRMLISGGAALPTETHELFAGLGLHLAEGYGLTETAPVLTVAEGVPGATAGTVGRPIPGVEIEIRGADAKGVGEVVARGPNVMLGYFEDREATAEVLDDEGWLRTGDLGRFDAEGRLVIVGRAKEVVVTPSGENVYLDDVEDQIGRLAGCTEWTLVGISDGRGGERLAAAWVLASEEDPALVATTIKKAFKALPPVFRPAVIIRLGEALPRTATQKVKRNAVHTLVEEALAARASAGDADLSGSPPTEKLDASAASLVPASAPVRAALALVAGIDAAELRGQTELSSDLSFDSLMWVELSAALEPLVGRLDPESLYACETVAEVEALVQEPMQEPDSSKGQVESRARREETESNQGLQVPGVIKIPARGALGLAQRDLYRTIFSTQVHGRARIPYNRAAIVVANHSSHLDTGLVKFALGRYGDNLRPLAAADYFFAGHPLKVAFFEHLTNLVPLDRSSGSGSAFDTARALVEAGEVILIYPEGTRGTTGVVADFKPLVGRLALATGAPVLPLYLGGAFNALPKGSFLPRARDLEVTIGPALEAADLARLTADLAPIEAARASARLIEKAVVELSQGRQLDLASITSLVEDMLADQASIAG